MESNVTDGHRYWIKLNLYQDDAMYNFWDYIESTSTLEEARSICDGLFDNSVRRIQIVDVTNDSIIESWC